ncbi:hypothetical protein DAVIS_05382 [Mycobacterium marinum]|uniref:Uncharacterized protein n=1 Tax=Mycobacterium marinum TaxID=1781 RepID=A0A3E2MN53_MYCMR|nr:hypothetical protein DAVIS_05382 [Mycobacterium marinum]
MHSLQCVKRGGGLAEDGDLLVDEEVVQLFGRRDDVFGHDHDPSTGE